MITVPRIVSVLGEFAKTTRYYNLDYLTGRRDRGRDPLVAWTDDVARYLMSDYPARLRQRDEDWAEVADELMGGRAIVRNESSVSQRPVGVSADRQDSGRLR